VTALLQGHVQVHRIPPVGFIERLEGDAAGAETKGAGIERDMVGVSRIVLGDGGEEDFRAIRDEMKD
jgi:hypothetical protein